MRRLVLWIAIAVAALVTVPTALADGGPIFATQGGAGVAVHAHPATHYVALPDERGGTLLVNVIRGAVYPGPRFGGSWGIPTIGYGSTSGAGLSQNDRTLVLESIAGPYPTRSEFLVINFPRVTDARTISLRGSFSFDALSPDGSRLYLIQYTSASDLSHYIVREYDMRTNRLLPGKVADRSEHEKSMAGQPMTRTTSSDGRWVYTLYQKPSGAPFIHALDTVRGVAYCIDLPANRNLYRVVLSLRNDDRTLAVDSRGGRPWLSVSVGDWRVSPAGGGAPWAWIGAGSGAGLAVLVAGGLLLWRRRGKEVEQGVGQELRLA